MKMNKLTIDINTSCNLECKFCYQDLDGSSLSKDDIFKIVDANPNSSIIEIGGGEPFLHSEILDIITGLREKGKKVHISTNATEIPKDFLDLDERIRHETEVQISLHASNPQLYGKITGRNLFDKVIKNIGIIKPKYKALITSAIYNENFNDVPDIVNLVNELDLPIRINLVFPIGKGKNVELIGPRKIDQLRNYLLGQKLQKGNLIDSSLLCCVEKVPKTGAYWSINPSRLSTVPPLLHINNCAALESYYGIEKKVSCPVDCGTKKYISSRGEIYSCEFVKSKVEVSKWI